MASIVAMDVWSSLDSTHFTDIELNDDGSRLFTDSFGQPRTICSPAAPPPSLQNSPYLNPIEQADLVSTRQTFWSSPYFLPLPAAARRQNSAAKMEKENSSTTHDR